jgi:K+-sensing histidine kinase KdpD
MATTKVDKRRRGNSADHIWLVARHDFRQPVQSLELLASARTDDVRRQCAERTAELAAALRAMVGGLTLVSSLEAGEVSSAPESVMLAGAVKAAIEAIGGHGAQIETRALDGRAHADPALLATALEGLLLYAVKFSAAMPVYVAARSLKREAVVEIGFEGRHPRTALSAMAFIELPPAAVGACPAVGLGPALLVRVAAILGWRLELGATSDQSARVLLKLKSPPRA